MEFSTRREKLEGEISVILRPSYHPFLFASSFYILEAVKNWTMGRIRNNATPNQACSNLVPPLTTEQYHRFTASNRYTAIAQTWSSLIRHLAFGVHFVHNTSRMEVIMVMCFLCHTHWLGCAFLCHAHWLACAFLCHTHWFAYAIHIRQNCVHGVPKVLVV